VFAAGTIQWSWGLANGDRNTYADPCIQQTTANILNTFISSSSASAGLNPTSLTFSSVVGATSAAQTITLTSTGNNTLNISNISITGVDAGDFAQTNNCPSTLSVSQSCTISVTFTPTATGSRSASVTITDNAANSPQSVALGGTGQAAAAPAVTLNPTSLTFGNQAVTTTSSPQAITLRNVGTASLSISSIALSGTNSGDFAQTNNCPTGSNTLAVNASCTINVTFTPTARGARGGTLTVSSNAPGTAPSVSLSGTGIAPVASLSPTSLTFATLRLTTTSAAKSVTLSNTGDATLHITSIAVTGDFAQTNNCSSTLAPGASCTVSVTFTPRMTGTRTGTLTVSDDASNASPQSTSLRGTGVDFAISASPSSARLTAGNPAR